MGYAPDTYCRICGEGFHEYHAPEERLCECCATELAEAEAEAISDEPFEEISYAK